MAERHPEPPTELARLAATVAALRDAQAATAHRLTVTERRLTAAGMRGAHRLARRRRIAAMTLALALALAPLGALALTPFIDLNSGSVHNANIDAIYNAGITTGCDPGVAYCPSGMVTREEMASFLARTAGPGGNPPVANAKTAQTAQTATNADLAVNANTVGGFAPSGLVRLASTTQNISFGIVTEPPVYTTLASVEIDAPGVGFVLLVGATTLYSSSTTGGVVMGEVRLYDVAAAAPATVNSLRARIGTLAGSAESAALSPVAAFPVATAGRHSYRMEATCIACGGGALGMYGATLTALFIPFGSTGTATP